MAALTLEGKPWYWGLGIGVVLAAAIIWLADWQLIDPVQQQIRAAESQIKELDTKIEQGRSAQRKLPQFREEVHRLELELEKLRRILPSTRNTERSEEHTSELQSLAYLVCRLLLEKKN